MAWLLVGGLMMQPAHALDIDALWNYRQPSVSEERFRAAMGSATADERLVLTTQIARAQGLRSEFEAARATLRSMEGQLPQASREARVRHALEWGRTWASAVHKRAEVSPEAVAEARRAWARAHDLALADAGPGDPRLEGLAVDALHMMVMIDTAPADQLAWNQKALALVDASSQPAAKAWEASLRHNTGLALRQLGRHEEALVQFARCRELRERSGNLVGRRVADWMTARTFRDMGRLDDAIVLQHRLEAEWAASGEVDVYVFEELAALYAAKGDTARAADYAQRHRKASASAQ